MKQITVFRKYKYRYSCCYEGYSKWFNLNYDDLEKAIEWCKQELVESSNNIRLIQLSPFYYDKNKKQIGWGMGYSIYRGVNEIKIKEN